MKRTKYLLLSILPFLCSCSFTPDQTFSWEKYKNDSVSMSACSSKYEKYSFKDYSKEILDLKSKLTASINNNGGNYENFVKYYNSLYSYYSDVIDCYVLSSTKYYSDSRNTEYKNKSDTYYEEYNSLRNYFIALETDIYHSPNSKIKNEYFYGMTDEQIEQRLEGNASAQLQNEYDEYFREMNEDGELLYNNYRNGALTETEYMSGGYDAFLSYINKTAELIGQIDYDTYLDYQYSNYFGRDYTYQNAAQFVNYVKQYIVPIYNACDDIDVPDNIDSTLLLALQKYNFCNRLTDSAEMFSAYAEDLGGKYLSSYNNAWKYGYWCFSDSNYSLTTAFEWNLESVNDGVLYFSKDYQKILTLVHEFGHYYSNTFNNSARAYDCMDLSETYSQGNEFTFLNYLLTQKESSQNKDTYQYFVDDYIYGNMFYIIQEAVITEIENFAYTTDNLTKETLKAGVESILSSYNGAASRTYFMGPCITSPCYYISYATSVVEALQFISVPYAQAKQMYVNLIEHQTGSTTVEKWQSAGLPSPFEETSLQNIANLFNTIKDRYNEK